MVTICQPQKEGVQRISQWRFLVLLSAAAFQVALAAPSYYEVLGVAKDADDRQIKKAYREKALKWHPDKNPENREEAEKRFREVAEAYEVLSNADRRRQYDSGSGDFAQGFANSGGFDFGNFGGFGFKDPKDLFKEMFGSEDPFADFNKFFQDVQFEEFGTGGSETALETLEAALAKFYQSVGQPEKASQVKGILQMDKWRGKEQKMFSSLEKKYSDPQFQPHLVELKKAFDALEKSRGGSAGFGDFGDLGGGFGDFGAFGDLGNFGNMFGGFGDSFGGSGSMMFSSSFSSSSDGRTTKSETRYENGKRVTKTIESDARGTRATMEEEEGGRIRRKSGSRPAEQLDTGREEM